MESKGNFLCDLFGKEISSNLVKEYSSELRNKNQIPFIHFLDDGLKDELTVVDKNGDEISLIVSIYDDVDYPLNRGPFFYASNYELNYSFKTWIIFTQDGLIIEDPNQSGERTLYSWDNWGEVLYTKHLKLNAPVILLANPKQPGVPEISISPVLDLNKNVKISEDKVEGKYDELTLEEMNLAYYILKTFWTVVEENRHSDSNTIPVEIFSFLSKKDFKFLEKEKSAKDFFQQGQEKMKSSDFQGAIEDFNEAIVIEPDNKWAHQLRGDAKSNLKDNNGAIADYTKVIEIDPNEKFAYRERGNAKLELKNYQSAIEDYNKFIAIDSNSDVIYQNRGDAKRELKDFQGAKDDFSKAIAIDSEWWGYYSKRGGVKHILKEYESAIEDFNKVIELNSNYKWAYQNRGNAKIGLNDFQGAVSDFTKVIEIDPNYKWAYQQRGIAKNNLSDYKSAITDFTKVIEIDPNYKWAYQQRGIAKDNLIDYKSAIADFNKVIEIDPNYNWGYFYRGLANYNLKHYQEAIEDFTKVIEISPNWANAYYNLGLCYHSLKTYDDAINNYIIAINKFNNNLNYYYNLERAKNKLEVYNENAVDLNEQSKDRNYINALYEFIIKQKFLDYQLENINQIIKIDSTFSKAYFLRAKVSEIKNKHKDAIEDLNIAIELNPNYIEALKLRGELLRRKKEYEKALCDFNKIIELSESIVPEIYIKRGTIRKNLEDFEGATEDFSVIIENDPMNDAAFFERALLNVELNNQSKALDDFSKAIELNVKYYDAYFERGNFKKQLKDYQGALEDYNKAYLIEPGIMNNLFEETLEAYELLEDIAGIKLYKSLIELRESSNHLESEKIVRNNFELLKVENEGKSNKWIYETLIANAKMYFSPKNDFCEDKNELILMAYASNPFITPEKVTTLLKGASQPLRNIALANRNCPIELLEVASKECNNYSDSKQRKVVALNLNTPKEIIRNLLKDDYRWVREAAAAHKSITQDEISSMINTADRYILKGLIVNPNCSEIDREKINSLLTDEKAYPREFSNYKISNKSRIGIKEVASGEINIEQVIEAINSELSWEDWMGSDFSNYNDLMADYGSVDFIDQITYPDGTKEDIGGVDLDLSEMFEWKKIKEGDKNIGDDLFFQVAVSNEKGNWDWEDFELEYEFKPKNLKPQTDYNNHIITQYKYEDQEESNVLIEGEIDRSEGSGIEITLYANTKEGVKEVYLEELEIDPNNKNIKSILINKFNLIKADTDEDGNNISDSGSSQQIENENSVTKVGNVSLFSDFDTWIAEMRNGQIADKSKGIKERKSIEITEEAEAVVRRFFDELNLKYSEGGLLSYKFSPTGGCTVYFKKRKVAGITILKKNIIQLMILRDYNRNYYRPLITDLNISNIREEQISHKVPWGYAFYIILNEPKLIDKNFDTLFSFIEDGITTIKFDRILSLKAKEYRKLKPIFDGIFYANENTI